MTTAVNRITDDYIFLTEDGEHRNDYHVFIRDGLIPGYAYSYYHDEWFKWGETALNGNRWRSYSTEAIPEFIRGIALLMGGT